MKILVVDDVQEMRRIIIEMINEADNKFFEAEDGEEAVHIYSSLMPDWVLMDINMKHMNGFEAAIRIKKNYPNAHIAIVSEFDDDYYRKYAQKIGIDAFISKQDLFELKNVIK